MAATATATATVETCEVEATDALDVEQLCARIAERHDTIKREVALANGDMKLLRKAAKRAARGTRRKRAPADAADGVDRKPSGFARPSLLSDDLCEFLGLAPGAMVPRTEVTKMICKYIKDNCLGQQENKRCVDFTKPAAAVLTKLLQPEAGATVTYFNLQRYLKRHIRKADGSPETDTATATPVATSTTSVVEKVVGAAGAAADTAKAARRKKEAAA
jgi:chromatin remodeling complex protein RSC6